MILQIVILDYISDLCCVYRTYKSGPGTDHCGTPRDNKNQHLFAGMVRIGVPARIFMYALAKCLNKRKKVKPVTIPLNIMPERRTLTIKSEISTRASPLPAPLGHCWLTFFAAFRYLPPVGIEGDKFRP